MDKILLLAYVNKNFGDDMFIKTICEALPDEEFVLEAPSSYAKMFEKINNLEVVELTKIRNVRKKVLSTMSRKLKIKIQDPYAKRFKAVVYVIGGLFDEDSIWYDNIKQYGLISIKNMILKYSLVNRVPFFLLGCNVTRVETEKYLLDMNFIFKDIFDICFRDKYSYKFFEKLENTRYAPDVVLNYNCNECKKDAGILISVWGPLTRGDKFPQWKWAESLWAKYKEFIINLSHMFVEEGKDVTLLALCQDEGDGYACEAIIEEGRLEDKVSVYSYDGDLEETIRLFETAEFTIGTRFHSIIMAINANCPFYPIVYESKTLQLLKDINYEGGFSHIENTDSYDTSMVLSEYKNNTPIDNKQIKIEAGRQFDKLREYLRR